MKKLFGLAAVLIAMSAAFWWHRRTDGDSEALFRTVPVERGQVVARVSATGTILPEEVVDVGAQIVGQIKRFGRAPDDKSKAIDYGTLVDEGTVLAQIDDTMYRSQVDQAKASCQRAEADLLHTRAQLHQAERDWRRARQLQARNAISSADFDSSEASYLTALSQVAVAEATIAQAKAALGQAEINLGYTTIRSPVKGVIVDRRVNVGQTVVANLDAPSLFLIAKDLKRLQVWASVNEADISKIHRGQKVHFRVQPYPGRDFAGVVSQVRLNATLSQNVVTYTVVVATDNSEGNLLPYMTATLQFEAGRRENVLVVPNAALRWRPQAHQVVPDARPVSADSQPSASPSGHKAGDRGQVWVEDGGLVRPVPVSVGLSDGTVTEIDGELREGTPVVVRGPHQNNKDAETTPFLTRMGSRK
jgi:HlyD family secretion protein